MNKFIGYLLCASVIFVGINCYAKSGNIEAAQSALSDTGVTAAIKAKFTKNKLLNPFDIKVTTKNGTVTLKGKVDSVMQYEQAIMIAESMYDVHTINAKALTVKNSKSPLKDTYITGKIKGKILKDKIFGDADFADNNLSVETVDGTVFLKGIVKNNAQIKDIITLVKSTDGVKSVKSSLSVKHT